MTPKRISAYALIVTGAFGLAWPFLPVDWGAWELIGIIFNATNDPTNGIEYMFYWLATGLYGLIAMPVGAAIVGTPARLIEAESEIERLRSEAAAMTTALQKCEYLEAEIARLRLTDEEREAVEAAVAEFAGLADEFDALKDAKRAATLRGLLERLK